VVEKGRPRHRACNSTGGDRLDGAQEPGGGGIGARPATTTNRGEGGGGGGGAVCSTWAGQVAVRSGVGLERFGSCKCVAGASGFPSFYLVERERCFIFFQVRREGGRQVEDGLGFREKGGGGGGGGTGGIQGEWETGWVGRRRGGGEFFYLHNKYLWIFMNNKS
jgi:hypothetical protein